MKEKVTSRICTICGTTKLLSEFRKCKSKKYGVQNTCKDCQSKNNMFFNNSIRGIVTNSYHRQKSLSKKRNHSQPKYSLEDLFTWFISNPKHVIIYNDYIMSCFDSKKKPSIDRIDDHKGYSFDNIQVITWKENNSKAHECKRNGVWKKHLCPVDQFDSEMNYIKSYISISDAGRKTGVDISGIANCCKGKQHHSGGFKWKYKKD